MAGNATVVLVHGAWHGAWCWNEVVTRLDAADVATVAVDLPSVARAPSDLHADADHVMQTIDRIDGSVVLIGHSYGGAVVTDAGIHPQVEHVVYLTAFALDDGESVLQNDLTGGEDMKLGEVIEVDGETCTVKSERLVEFFYHDCSPETAAWAARECRPMSLAAMRDVPRATAWRSKPATYVVCTDDRALPVALQQANATRVGTIVEMPTSHSPFLSRPELVADLLRELSAR